MVYTQKFSAAGTLSKIDIAVGGILNIDIVRTPSKA